jgi:DNA invertase Pin-like site-specific DNA recombinase
MLLNGKRAAQYVRMSTDMQQYSLENQADAIAVYAARRGLAIVRSYEDAGKSGLRLETRHGLKALLDDVKSGRADFDTILVYDVSRWGRFQDTDESAYYEYICKEAGVAVEYCAEQFENDGSLTATVLKNIKRAMAGEYSRELSVKVHAGQCRIAAMGFRRGSSPGYGLRRCLVDAQGRRKGELASGEWKNITTDRIILVPGPAHEIETIHRMYWMFVDEGLTLDAIADRLNGEGSQNAHGRMWLATAVRDVLSNEKYIGNNVFNLTSVTLKGRWRSNPPSQWVRANGAFEPIVPRDLFDRARHLLDRNRSFTANELLDFLTAIWCCRGTISVEALNACRYAPSPGAYQRCFGGLMNAYVLLGFVKPRVRTWAKNQKFRTAMNQEIIEGMRSRGGGARLMPGGGYILRINEELSLATSVVRLLTTDHNDKRWVFGYKTKKRPDILIIARVAEGQEILRDFFILPYLLIGRNWLTFSEGDAARLEPFQMTSLAPLLDIFARAPIRSAGEAGGVPLLKPSENPLAANCTAWPSAGVEESIAGIIDRLRSVLADHEFADLLSEQGFRTIPQLLAAADQPKPSGGYGRSLLDFAVAWGFISRLMASPKVVARLRSNWPDLQVDMKMTYLSVLTTGPLVRLPWGFHASRDAMEPQTISK